MAAGVQWLFHKGLCVADVFAAMRKAMGICARQTYGHCVFSEGEVVMGRTAPKNSIALKQPERSGNPVGLGSCHKMEVDEMWFKSWFLKALRDNEVKSAIKEITAEAVVSVKVRVPEGRVVELERELQSKDRSLKAAENQSLKVAKQLEIVEKECEKARARQKESEIQREGAYQRCEEAQAELRMVKSELRKLNGLSEMSKAFELYQKLPSSTRKVLNGVVNGKDLLSFVCTGAQESNLDRFWDLCNEAFIDGDDDASTMADIFNSFFDLIQMLGTVNARERLSVNAGDRFDNDLCTRIAHSAPTGSVREVLFQGYRYKVSKKIVRKSLVLV